MRRTADCNRNSIKTIYTNLFPSLPLILGCSTQQLIHVSLLLQLTTSNYIYLSLAHSHMFRHKRRRASPFLYKLYKQARPRVRQCYFVLSMPINGINLTHIGHKSESRIHTVFRYTLVAVVVAQSSFLF